MARKRRTRLPQVRRTASGATRSTPRFDADGAAIKVPSGYPETAAPWVLALDADHAALATLFADADRERAEWWARIDAEHAALMARLAVEPPPWVIEEPPAFTLPELPPLCFDALPALELPTLADLGW